MTTTPHILYIEDERAVIDLVRTALKMSGYDLTGATSGTEGLALMRQQKPDLVLLDLMMPEPNGWQVYREMKADEALANLPVIIVTASIWEGNSRVLLDDLPPVEDYITKPFDMLRLIRAIEQILKRGAAV